MTSTAEATLPHALLLIALLPLAGFLLNGILATKLSGTRAGTGFVNLVACGLPLAAFAITVKTFLDLRAGGYAPIVEQVYRWAIIDGASFDIAFYFDRLSAVMTLIVTGV